MAKAKSTATKAKAKKATTQPQEKIENDTFFVPAEVLRTFKGLYPDINLERVTWSWEVPFKIYEAEFEYRNKEYEVEILTTGYHYLTEMSLQVKDLPEVVKNTIKLKYEGYKMEEAEMLTYSNGDVHYEVGLSKGDDELEVHVREDGYFIGAGEDL